MLGTPPQRVEVLIANGRRVVGTSPSDDLGSTGAYVEGEIVWRRGHYLGGQASTSGEASLRTADRVGAPTQRSRGRGQLRVVEQQGLRGFRCCLKVCSLVEMNGSIQVRDPDRPFRANPSDLVEMTREVVIARLNEYWSTGS